MTSNEFHKILYLSPREYEVFSLLGLGKGLRDIGGVMNLSLHTVERHMHHIFMKLGLRTINSARELAVRYCTWRTLNNVVRRVPAIPPAPFEFATDGEIIDRASPGPSWIRMKDWRCREAMRRGVGESAVAMDIARGKYPRLKIHRSNKRVVFVEVANQP